MCLNHAHTHTYKDDFLLVFLMRSPPHPSSSISSDSLPGLRLDPFSALPFVKGRTGTRLRGSKFSLGGGPFQWWLGRLLCGGFWPNVCPSACPSEVGLILTFTAQVVGWNILCQVRDAQWAIEASVSVLMFTQI